MNFDGLPSSLLLWTRIGDEDGVAASEDSIGGRRSLVAAFDAIVVGRDESPNGGVCNAA